MKIFALAAFVAFLSLQELIGGNAHAQAPAPAIPDGEWKGTYDCGAVLTPNARSPKPFSLPITMITQDRVASLLRETRLTRDAMSGTVGGNGQVQLTGDGFYFDEPSREWRWRFEGRFTGQRFQATGVLESMDGKQKVRDCTISLGLVQAAPVTGTIQSGKNGPKTNDKEVGAK